MNGNNIDSKKELKELVILVLIIGIIAAGAYLFTEKFVINNRDIVINEETNNILASETFLLDEYKYYVLFIDMDDYTSNKIYNDFLQSKFTSPLYIVDYSEDVNKVVLSTESNDKVSSYEELGIKDVTLLEIEEGKVISYTEGFQEIIKKDN